MPGTIRGGNTASRVKRQRVHSFSATRGELRSMKKSELIEKAEELGVLNQVPATGESDTPLKKDLVNHLLDVSKQILNS